MLSIIRNVPQKYTIVFISHSERCRGLPRRAASIRTYNNRVNLGAGCDCARGELRFGDTFRIRRELAYLLEKSRRKWSG